ncbi:ornithine cyclodeaminase family protein [Kurthia sibirica]|uniref:Ornithine cyclodeaminase n=1 Tax=Kurthia sibirica TaxID=202750 RepID=A0A2U3APC8_9BACL|nr:ornithine cyclodeaminase [Kurthia sibirica]PWI26410.1 ornithine cyclodeaminase [Kurthia sibirica]GEK32971.1 ornithine cyclodeaminase [Kurthia sibirica]
MIILEEHQIQQHYTMKDAIDDVKKVLKSKYLNKLETPIRTVIDFPAQDASILYMPSADSEQQFAANKIVSIFPNNAAENLPTTQGVTLLSDAQNGRSLALLNASYLTRLRTGALTAIATDYLAQEEAKVLTVIGTGGMAFEQVLGILAVREIETIYLVNRTIEKAVIFQQRLQKHYPKMMIIVSEDVNNAVAQAQIINCATRSTTAVFDAAYVKAGCHINGVGSYLPTMREIDEALINTSNKIIVDDFHGVEEEAGEFIHAARTTDWSFDDLHGSLEQLEMKKISGRQHAEEITIFKSVGASYYDLAVAIGVYKKALAEHIGTIIPI